MVAPTKRTRRKKKITAVGGAAAAVRQLQAAAVLMIGDKTACAFGQIIGFAIRATTTTSSGEIATMRYHNMCIVVATAATVRSRRVLLVTVSNPQAPQRFPIRHQRAVGSPNKEDRRVAVADWKQTNNG